MTSTRVITWEEEYNTAKAASVMIMYEIRLAQADKQQHRAELFGLLARLNYQEISRLEKIEREELAKRQQNK